MSIILPALQYYSDKTFGFEAYAQKSNKEVIYEQRTGESREEFFERVGDSPKVNCYGHNEQMDELVASEHLDDRLIAARLGYGFEILKYDDNHYVRLRIINSDYDLDWFMGNGDTIDRSLVVSRGYRLDTLINDESDRVREEVARKGYGLEILINDKSEWVRQTVAEQGYGLNCLSRDESVDVRKTVRSYLGYNGMNLKSWYNISKDNIFNEDDFKHFYDLDDMISNGEIDGVVEIVESFPEHLTIDIAKKIFNNEQITTSDGSLLIYIIANEYGCDVLFDCYDGAKDNGKFLYDALLNHPYRGSSAYESIKSIFRKKEQANKLIEFMNNNGEVFFKKNDIGWKIYKELGFKLVSN